MLMTVVWMKDWYRYGKEYEEAVEHLLQILDQYLNELNTRALYSSVL